MKKIFLSITTLFVLVMNTNAQYWNLTGNSNATSSSKLGTTNNISLRFYTNNVQRMIINSAAGDVGIGTTSPTDRLHVNSPSGENALRVQVNGSTKLLVHSAGGVSIGSNSTPPANGLFVSGNVGIGITAPTSALDVNGTIGASALNVNGTINGGTIHGYNANNDHSGDDNVDAVIGEATGRYSGAGVSGHGPIGVYGEGVDNGWSSNIIGGFFSGNTGVEGSGEDYGLYGESTYGVGIYATTSGSPAYAGKFISTNYRGIYATGKSGSYAAYFNGSVYSTGSYISSDMRLKKNIKDFSNAMDIINQLKPKNYEFRNDGNYLTMNLPQGYHYGLLAQDVEQVLPNLVKEEKNDFNDSKVQGLKSVIVGKGKIAQSSIPQQKETNESIDVKAVNYIELIPILIKGMQEQQSQIKELSAKNEDLQNQINALKSLIIKSNTTTSFTSSSGGYLKQNTPNPATNNTVISYYLPENTGKAQITITDAKGSAVKVYNATKGEGRLNITSAELPAGTYNYTLSVNEKKIDSKQMVITK